MRALACASCVVVASMLFARPTLAADAGAPGDLSSRVVVVLASAAHDDIAAEATARVEGELGAAGFQVQVVPFAGGDPRADLESASADAAPLAAFAIVTHPSAGGTVAEIWVSDRSRQTTVVQRARLTETDHQRQSAVLAVRAVELLKASLAEAWLQPAAPPPAPVAVAAPPPPPAPPPAPVPVPQEARPPRAAFAAGLGIGAGAAVLDDFGRVGAFWAPSLLVSYGWDNGWSVNLAFEGLGLTPTVAEPQGTATLEEQVGALNVTKTWWPRWPVVPLLCAGAGVEHLHVHGSASPPYQAAVRDVWSAFTSAGLGAAVPIRAGLSLVVEARAAAAWPPTTVRIDGIDAGRVGDPSLLAGATVLGVFP